MNLTKRNQKTEKEINECGSQITQKDIINERVVLTNIQLQLLPVLRLLKILTRPFPTLFHILPIIN